MQSCVFEKGLLEKNVNVVLLVDADEETNSRHISLQVDLYLFDYLDCFGPVYLCQAFLVF